MGRNQAWCKCMGNLRDFHWNIVHASYKDPWGRKKCDFPLGNFPLPGFQSPHRMTYLTYLGSEAEKVDNPSCTKQKTCHHQNQFFLGFFNSLVLVTIHITLKIGPQKEIGIHSHYCTDFFVWCFFKNRTQQQLNHSSPKNPTPPPKKNGSFFPHVFVVPVFFFLAQRKMDPMTSTG